jgi:ABC-type polysaccharide/polyol phosphate export permease
MKTPTKGDDGVVTAPPRPASSPPADVSSRATVAAGSAWSENRAPAGWLPRLGVGELWRFRELALVLALRDIKVRYKQTVFGLAWVILQPLVAVVIFTIMFGRLARLPSEDLPYAVFVYSGLVLWGYFSGALDTVAQSLVQNRDLVTKTYFPALVAPLAFVLPGLVDLLVSLGVVGVVIAAYGVVPGPALVLLPLWIGACVLVVLAAGLWLSALNVQYRDVRHTMTFLLQVWLFASPVVYASSLVQGGWLYLYAVNPMVTVLNGFRWSLVDGPAPGWEALVSFAVVALGLAGGLVYFLRAERRFADLI